LQDLESTVNTVAADPQDADGGLQGRLTQVLDQVRALEREVGSSKGKLASSKGG
jgi:alanyl-tRNA synthetase